MRKLLTSLFLVPFLMGCGNEGGDVGGDPMRGEKLVLRRCAHCHNLSPSDLDRRGPDLMGLLGRVAGSHPEYRGYSGALKSYGAVWTPDLLKEYLVHPAAFLQEKTGNPKATSRMNVRTTIPKDRDDIVAYFAARKSGWAMKDQ